MDINYILNGKKGAKNINIDILGKGGYKLPKLVTPPKMVAKPAKKSTLMCDFHVNNIMKDMSVRMGPMNVIEPNKKSKPSMMSKNSQPSLGFIIGDKITPKQKSYLSTHKGIDRFMDFDKDMVPNGLDCDWINSKKHGLLARAKNLVTGKGFKENYQVEEEMLKRKQVEAREQTAQEVNKLKTTVESEREKVENQKFKAEVTRAEATIARERQMEIMKQRDEALIAKKEKLPRAANFRITAKKEAIANRYESAAKRAETIYAKKSEQEIKEFDIREKKRQRELEQQQRTYQEEKVKYEESPGMSVNLYRTAKQRLGERKELLKRNLSRTTGYAFETRKTREEYEKADKVEKLRKAKLQLTLEQLKKIEEFGYLKSKGGGVLMVEGQPVLNPIYERNPQLLQQSKTANVMFLVKQKQQEEAKKKEIRPLEMEQLKERYQYSKYLQELSQANRARLRSERTKVALGSLGMNQQRIGSTSLKEFMVV